MLPIVDSCRLGLISIFCARAFWVLRSCQKLGTLGTSSLFRAHSIDFITAPDNRSRGILSRRSRIYICSRVRVSYSVRSRVTGTDSFRRIWGKIIGLGFGSSKSRHLASHSIMILGLGRGIIVIRREAPEVIHGCFVGSAGIDVAPKILGALG